MKNEILFRFIKVCDIGYITAIYFLLAVLFSKLADKIVGTFDENKERQKSKIQQTLELIGMFWLYIVIIYIVKNIVELIPSPFDGINGFNHSLVKELHSGFAFFFIFLYLQRHFLDKILYYMNLPK
jgi:hypothetical protein